MSRIREQNRRLAFQALKEASLSPWFWGPLLLAFGLHLARTEPWLFLFVGALALASFFLRALARMEPSPLLDPEWATYRETRRLREEVERLRRALDRR